jgi:hypothetical protein
LRCTCAHLSPLLCVLQATLLHTAASLTDLDLSFAYMGYPGAEVLTIITTLRTQRRLFNKMLHSTSVQSMGRVLSAEGCQIIRLALIGNAIGDAGMVTMSKSLQVTHLGKDRCSLSSALMRAFMFYISLTRATRR